MSEDSLYLGVDLGGTDIKSVVLDAEYHQLWSRQIETRGWEGRDAVVARMADLAASASRELAPASIGAIGIAVPGVVDMDSGVIELLTNLTPDWNGFGAQERFQELTGMPVRVLNDVRAATLAEHVLGAGQGYSDFICIAVGTGVGGGLVLDGRLFKGSRGAAGEIGHFTVVPDGPLCSCGNRGCLEAVASATALAREARGAIAAGHTELLEMTGTETPSVHELAAAADAGSAVARELFEHAGRMIGLVAGSLICVLNPQAVVIGGGVARAGDLLLEPIRREIAQRTVVFLPERGGVDVLASPMGGQAGAIGAAAWAMLAREGEA